MTEEKKKQDPQAAPQLSVMVKKMETKEDGRVLYFYSFVPAVSTCEKSQPPPAVSDGVEQ